MRNSLSHFRGCLLGGAVGDALGAAVEFMNLDEIRGRFGPNGIQAPARAYGRVGAITDDTQMALFTAEGLLRARHQPPGRRPAPVPVVVHAAYLRWLRTQGERPPKLSDDGGWLFGVRELHAQRAPGSTCLEALRSGLIGTPRDPLNDSKGCGGVMRIAPDRRSRGSRVSCAGCTNLGAAAVKNSGGRYFATAADFDGSSAGFT